MKINRKHFLTGDIRSMELDITMQQLVQWQSGGLIQNVMPALTLDEREFLITGVLPGEFEELYGEEE